MSAAEVRILKARVLEGTVDARRERRGPKVFLADPMPAYITWHQYQRNQTQLH